MQRIAISQFSISSELLVDSIVFDAPKCLVYTNFLELNEEFGRHHLRELYIARKHTIPEVRLHRLPAGVELSTRADEDFIVCRGDRVLAEQIRPYWTDAELGAAIAGAAGLVDVSAEAVLLARAGIRTWGHWLIELLPKALCVEQMYPGRFRYIVPESIVADADLRTMRQSLEAYGFGPERLLFVRGNRKYQFTNLFAVSPIWFPQHALHPRVAAIVRRISPALGQLPEMPLSIALLRRGSTTRNLANVDQVCNYLTERGWLIIDPERLDFIDQVRLFSGCENVIGALGSGLAGLVYAPQGVKVASLAPSHWGDLFFFSLMQERHARLADIRGVSAGSNFSDAQRLPFALDIADLEAGLRALDMPVGPLLPERTAAPAADTTWRMTTPHALLKTALSLREAGKFAEAKELMRQLAHRAPSDPVVKNHLVDLLMHQGEIAEAIRFAEQNFALYPSGATLRLVQDHLTRLGHYSEAVDFARREVALDAADSEAFSRLGHALCRVNEFDEAASCFDRALSQRGSDLGLYLARSRALACAGRLDAAAAALQAAITASPAETALYLQLAEVFALQGKIEAATGALNKVIAVEPGNADALAALRSLGSSGLPDRTDLASAELAPPFRGRQLFSGVPSETPSLTMDYVQFLAAMKRVLRPSTYLEIGIAQGTTLLSHPVPEFVIGIDPNPQLGAAIVDQISACRNLLLLRSTSDDAFAVLAEHKLLGDRKSDIAFVDGLHHSDAVLRDIANCARFSRQDALIFVHDVFPENEIQASRQEIPGTWMGDVYKVVPIIWRHLGWVETLLVNDIPPSGMFILRITGDIHDAIFSQYDVLVTAMERCEYAATLEEINAKAVSRTSRPFAEFIEHSIRALHPGESAAQTLLRSMMA